MNEYNRKLQDYQWKTRRLEILERDGFMCTDCYSSGRDMQVHHLYYEYGKDPWDYPDEALITLCRFCHETEHKRFKSYLGEERELSLRKEGFRAKDFENLQYASFAVQLGVLKEGGAIEDCRKMIRRRVENYRYKVDQAARWANKETFGEWA